VLHHTRGFYRYDVEGGEQLGVITVCRNRFTKKFKSATYQWPSGGPMRLDHNEYLAIRGLQHWQDAAQLLLFDSTKT
jgi:hypothetical protein